MTTSEFDSVVYGIYNDIFEHQAIPESALTGVIGMNLKPGTRVTSGGATGFYAMRTAIMEVASGMSDTVLCIGGEKATDCYDPQSKSATPMVIDTIAKSWDPFFEYPLGATASDSYMQMCMGYNDEYPNDHRRLGRPRQDHRDALSAGEQEPLRPAARRDRHR